jgi:hypothetical protein
MAKSPCMELLSAGTSSAAGGNLAGSLLSKSCLRTARVSATVPLALVVVAEEAEVAAEVEADEAEVLVEVPVAEVEEEDTEDPVEDEFPAEEDEVPPEVAAAEVSDEAEADKQ